MHLVMCFSMDGYNIQMKVVPHQEIYYFCFYGSEHNDKVMINLHKKPNF